jgi:quinol monooxygenase YgiN
MTNTPVTLSGSITVKPDDLGTVLEQLEHHIQLTREELGCIEFSVTQRVNNPLIFDVYEAFLDSTAFDIHQARIKKSAWAIATINAERNYTLQNYISAE